MNATLPRLLVADQFPLFDVLTPVEKQRLEDISEYKIKPRYSYIYLADEPSDAMFLLARGAVKIGMHSNDGKEIIKSLIHPKSVFGEMGLIGETRRQEFAQTLKEEVHLFVIRIADFKQLMKSNFALSDRVMSAFGDRLMRAERKLESLIFKDARTRIVEFIRDSVELRGHKVGFEMLLKHSLTHQDIANITCTSRQTVTLVLNELRKSDLIYFNRGKILVRDIGKLC
jgi:CRP/FNR family transcriptional regulator, cyclic AMP receptor protein